MGTPADLAETLLPHIAAWRAKHGEGLFTLAICGAQGSGKSSLVAALSAKLKDAGLRHSTRGVGVMTSDLVSHFVQHYERLTKHILAEMPRRADLVIRLGRARTVLP